MSPTGFRHSLRYVLLAVALAACTSHPARAPQQGKQQESLPYRYLLTIGVAFGHNQVHQEYLQLFQEQLELGIRSAKQERYHFTIGRKKPADTKAAQTLHDAIVMDFEKPPAPTAAGLEAYKQTQTRTRARLDALLLPRLRNLLYKVDGQHRKSKFEADKRVVLVASDVDAVFALEQAVAIADKRGYATPGVVLINPSFIYPLKDTTAARLSELQCLVVWTHDRIVRGFIESHEADELGYLTQMQAFEGRAFREYMVTVGDANRQFVRRQDMSAKALRNISLMTRYILQTISIAGQDEVAPLATGVEAYEPDFELYQMLEQQRHVEQADIFGLQRSRLAPQMPAYRDLDGQPVNVTGEQLRLARIAHKESQDFLGGRLLAELGRDSVEGFKQALIRRLEWQQGASIASVLEREKLMAIAADIDTYVDEKPLLEVPVSFPEFRGNADKSVQIARQDVRYFRRKDLLFLLAFLDGGQGIPYSSPIRLNDTLEYQVDAIKALLGTRREQDTKTGLNSKVRSDKWRKERIKISKPRSQANLGIFWRIAARTYNAIWYYSQAGTQDPQKRRAAAGLRRKLLTYLKGAPDTSANERADALLEAFDREFEAAGLLESALFLQKGASEHDAALLFATFMPDSFFRRMRERYKTEPFHFSPLKGVLPYLNDADNDWIAAQSAQ